MKIFVTSPSVTSVPGGGLHLAVREHRRLSVKEVFLPNLALTNSLYPVMLCFGLWSNEDAEGSGGGKELCGRNGSGIVTSKARMLLKNRAMEKRCGS